MYSLRPQDIGNTRKQELDTAIKNIKAGKKTVISAPDRFGKSSLLISIQARLKDSNSHTPIIFTAENCTDLTSYIKHNTRNILKAYPEIFPEPDTLFSLSMLDIDGKLNDLDLPDNAKTDLKLLLLFNHDTSVNLEDVLKTLITFPQHIDAKTAPVVLLDEVELFPTIKSDKTSASKLLELLGSAEPGVFVLASSTKLDLPDTEQLVLAPLELDEARDVLSELGPDETSLTTIHNFSGGVPYYVNYMARMMKFTGKFDSASVNNMIDDALSNELHMYFSQLLKSLSPKELPILFCMAEHNVNTPSRISKLLNYSQTNVRRFLSIMEEKGFVTLKERGVFEIHDPVFRRWLEHQSRL